MHLLGTNVFKLLTTSENVPSLSRDQQYLETYNPSYRKILDRLRDLNYLSLSLSHFVDYKMIKI